ncbi:helix-turn-helix domain-containing protein [Rhodoferax aquaticus]|uniref:AraC family transcriptional regulator n=1 Tax=Rhodoferax aquaticus TaxID=2527691 RepID=A0A515EPV8_9BURK|nr:AraC family transcriptional regulator [Rhodoferax aquaticus]QDL54711.1 AraC family transcriptional regulator [Rhodoferax aquaticus]
MSGRRVAVHAHPQLPGLALVDAHFVEQHFPKHSHDGYSIGVVRSGVNAFWHRGGQQHAIAGSLCIVNPGEVHTGDTVTPQGWSYFNLLVPELLLQTSRATLDLPAQTLHFGQSVVADAQAATALLVLGQAMLAKDSPLAVEQHWLELCGVLLSRHVSERAALAPVSRMPRQVARAREVLDADLLGQRSLSELAALCHVSPFHLVRSFSAHVGLPPHAYQLQKRLEQAKARVQQGEALASIAAATGFADQAHMSRHFQRQWGVPPGQFAPLRSQPQNRKNVQYR